MNKLAQLQLAKELLAQEYLQKQAALEKMIKDAVSEQMLLRAMAPKFKQLASINTRLSEGVSKLRRGEDPEIDPEKLRRMMSRYLSVYSKVKDISSRRLPDAGLNAVEILSLLAGYK